MPVKSFLIFIFTLMIALPTFAQGDVGDGGNWMFHPARENILKAGVSEDVKYDVPPTFPGGMDSLVSFVLQRIDYSVYNKADVVGTVLVEFTVEADGSISSPEIKVRLFPDCDENALQIVREMPHWQPATYEGKPIRCKYTLPVTFIM